MGEENEDADEGYGQGYIHAESVISGLQYMNFDLLLGSARDGLNGYDG
jgi:hypothetical protein